MSSFKLTIITPEGTAFENEVESLVAPGSQGFFGILAHHAPMVANLKLGTLTLTQGGQAKYFVIGNGVLEVSDNEVSILAGQAHLAHSFEEAQETTKTTEEVF
ncbi:MAG: ATP synthase F1 subunit epsilon [Kiritimatiellae bacterium]|nr:ATP synthase F1 subunit epsilon [Kiritimatiellia bacterium]